MLGFHPHIDRTQAGAGDAGAALEARMRRTGLMLPAIVATCIVAAWSLTACYFVWRLEDRISRNDFAAASESQVLALQVASLLIGGILVLYLSASL